MFCVVQIGSSTLRSPCGTMRAWRGGFCWARVMNGAPTPASAAVASPADNTFLLDVFTDTSPLTATDEFFQASERSQIGQVEVSVKTSRRKVLSAGLATAAL